MGILNQIAEYLYLKKKDPDTSETVKENVDKEQFWSTRYMKSMHKINRLSIFLFLAAMVFMLVKFLVRK